jgi:hypothetical protein
MQDFQEGPHGQNAVGVTVCKVFDGVQFQGKVDGFRQVRQRFYYHIIYSDGDEEGYNDFIFVIRYNDTA